MKLILGIALVLVLAYPARAQDKITVGEALAISGALNQLNCQTKIVKDGAKETVACIPYDHKPGLMWLISGNTAKLKPIVEQYSKVHNELLAKLPRKPDGNLTDEAVVKLAVADAEWQAAPADVKLDPFTRVTIEALNPMPAIVSALWPIIEKPQ